MRGVGGRGGVVMRACERATVQERERERMRGRGESKQVKRKRKRKRGETESEGVRQNGGYNN